MKAHLWDPIRRMPVVATPEERVRQGFIDLMIRRGYPLSAIQVEYSAGTAGRFDIAVSAPDGSLWLLAECKAPTQTPQAVWRAAWTQVRRYARVMPLPRYFAVAIGTQVWCWEAKDALLLPELPGYPR